MEIMDRGTEQEDGEAGLDSVTKAAESSALSLAMRNATDNPKLSLDSNNTGTSGNASKVDKHINLFMNDKEGDAYNTAEESAGEDSGMNMSEDYKSNVTEVSSGIFEASFSKKYVDPKDFKQELWNSVGLLSESMIVYINLLRKELEDAHNNLPFNVATFGCLYELLVNKSGEDYCDNLRFLDSIKGEIAALANLDGLDNPLLEIQCPRNNTEKDDTAAPVCNWATEVKCFRPGLSPIQCQHKNCTTPIHHLC
jgi:hypothetical protein